MKDYGLKRELGLGSAILVVVASMIGAGIFGNTGIIQAEVGSPVAVILLWILGGAIALSGAMCYAELATQMPHAGGEYLYIRTIFGRIPSFLTGWVSFLVGFSAPAASAALLSADYASEFFKIAMPGSSFDSIYADPLNRKIHGTVMILLFSFFHMQGVRKGGFVQNVLTVVKLVLVIVFAVVGITTAFLAGQHGEVISAFQGGSITTTGLGVGLLFVMFAYSGWNGATYLAGEIKDPEKNLPRSLLYGTGLIILLYFLLNLLYYMAVPVSVLSGKEAVAALAVSHLFGNQMAVFFNLAFFLMLLSSLSVSIMIGPRVYYAMARDKLFFQSAAKISPKYGTPVISIWIQAALAIIYVLSGKYDEILVYMGFALGIFPILTVAGLIRLRRRAPELKRPYKTPLYPYLPIFFMLFSISMLVTSFIGRPLESSIALGVVMAGIPVYFIWNRFVNLYGEEVTPDNVDVYDEEYHPEVVEDELKKVESALR